MLQISLADQILVINAIQNLESIRSWAKELNRHICWNHWNRRFFNYYKWSKKQVIIQEKQKIVKNPEQRNRCGMEANNASWAGWSGASPRSWRAAAWQQKWVHHLGSLEGSSSWIFCRNSCADSELPHSQSSSLISPPHPSLPLRTARRSNAPNIGHEHALCTPLCTPLSGHNTRILQTRAQWPSTRFLSAVQSPLGRRRNWRKETNGCSKHFVHATKLMSQRKLNLLFWNSKFFFLDN